MNPYSPEPVPPLSTFDRALSAAVKTWGGDDRDAVLARLSPELRRTTEMLLSATAGEDGVAWLAHVHEAEARFDPAHVHPTWWVRALADESEAVKRVVALHGPKNIAKATRLAFRLDAEALRPDHPAHPLAQRWALSLWPERLVGGEPVTKHDPLVVQLLGSRPIARKGALKSLVEGIAECKRAYDPLHENGLGQRAGDRPEPDPRFVRLTRQDVAAHPGVAYHDLPVLGLLTLGRLLNEVEPFRARWAVQHLPYPAAKAVRSLRTAETELIAHEELIAWEHSILSTAANEWVVQT